MPLGYLLIPLIGLFGFFALKSSEISSVPRTPPLVPKLASSGRQDIDQEVQAAGAALLASFRTLGCAGLDIPAVHRFQVACNLYLAATRPGTPVLPTDGVFDHATNAFLAAVTGFAMPLGCEPTVLVQASTPATSLAQQVAEASTADSRYGVQPGWISPTAGKMTY
jgi:hypothetical protein